MLTGAALIMFMIESLFPPLFLPGAKMGISNICTLTCLIVLTPFDAVILIAARTFLGSLFAASMSTLIYSLSAGLVSVVVSAILVRFVYPKISIISISITSAVIHNITQSLVFVFVTGIKEMLVYMPYLALIGILAGIIVGFATYFLIKAIPMSTFDKLYQRMENLGQ